MIRALGKNKKQDRPKNDFYCTPFSLTWALTERHELSHAWEPACGRGSIVKPLQDLDMEVEYSDIDAEFDPTGYSRQFFEFTEPLSKTVISNPPFSLWDLFVFHAKMLGCQRIMYIGKTDYFSADGRSKSGIWKNLKHVEIFNRKVDYQTPYREDGLFHVGAMTSAWFIWESGYTGKPMIDIIDVQPYAKLGQFKKRENGFNTKTKQPEKKD